MSPVRCCMMRIGALLAGLLAAMPGLAQPPAELSVLTYNIEGLPWPARSDRAENLSRIADQLQSLRAEGHQPHVVLFEEAFSADARAVAVKAGYRYIVDGPAASDAGAPPASAADRAFMAAARFLSGEKWGKWRGSGLRIASDYPILDVKRMAYPTCAGMDCLANKGLLLVTIAVPGAPQPVAIVATHLNPRRASRVPVARSYYAYQRQIDALSDFVRANIAPGTPFIVAGDFNAEQERRPYLLQRAAGWRAEAPVQAALDACLAAGDQCRADNRDDLAFSQHRGRDWQLFASGRSESLKLKSMAALFGHDADGHMLSDHVGYAATYAIANEPVEGAANAEASGEKQPVALAVRDQSAPREGGAPR